MPRERMYSSNAERQAAYRARLNHRHALADSGQLVARRLAELETALAAMTRRAQTAEARAARAEAQAAELRDRKPDRSDTPAARPARTPPGPKGRDQVRLMAAMQRIAELETAITELQQQLATPATPSKTAGPNRAARRATERDQRRRP